LIPLHTTGIARLKCGARLAQVHSKRGMKPDWIPQYFCSFKEMLYESYCEPEMPVKNDN
jgi:hypothetical protein